MPIISEIYTLIRIRKCSAKKNKSFLQAIVAEFLQIYAV